MKQGDIEALHCHSCARTAAHRVAACDCFSWTEQSAAGAAIDFEVRHYMLVCQECHTAQLRSLRGAEQLFDELTERYFPPHPVRVFPTWANQLPPNMAVLLSETHAALANQQYWLVAMGARTLFDMFALKTIGDTGGFKEKLKRLVSETYLSEKDRNVIEAALEIGHGATHRNQLPSSLDCNRVLDITENLLQRLVNAVSAANIQEARALRKSDS